MTINAEVRLSLDDAVAEVLGLLTGLDLTYAPTTDRYRAITRQLNRALRSVALEQEWAWYSSVVSIGPAHEGETRYALPPNARPRISTDDAVRLVDKDGMVVRWAYILPRDAGHKYQDRHGVQDLRCTVTREIVEFTRPLWESENGLDIHVPVMREPVMFRLPDDKLETVPTRIRKQLVDFPYPDLVIARAAYYVAQSDPVMQPRVATLEDNYKTLMYALVERDTAHTDSPYINEFILPIENGLHSIGGPHHHPHA